MADAVRLWASLAAGVTTAVRCGARSGCLGWNFAGQFTDQVASMDALAPPSGLMMSVTVHVVMPGLIVLIVLVAHRRRAMPRAILQS